MTGEQKQWHLKEGDERVEEGGDDARIGELFERAELGHPFGYRRDVNLLMDVICDRLSSRLCHRCVRQTSDPTCPRLTPATSESCQCHKSDGTGPNVGQLLQGRDQITQTISPRCESCDTVLFDKNTAEETVSKSPQDFSVQSKDKNLLNVQLRSRDDGYPDSELLPCHSRRVRFLKNCGILEEKFRQGRAESTRTVARGTHHYKPFTSYTFETDRPYHPSSTEVATTSYTSEFGEPKDKTDKPLYIKGSNPLLDKMKYELENDEETKDAFAEMYWEDDTPLMLVPPPLFETPQEFENKTVGATRHNRASPIDLLRKRLNLNCNSAKSILTRDVESNAKSDKLTKTVENDSSRDMRRTDVKDTMMYGVSSDEEGEIDPSFHRQLMTMIPRPVGQSSGRCNALTGFANKMSLEATMEGTHSKSYMYPNSCTPAYESAREKMLSHNPASNTAQPFHSEQTSIEPDSMCEDRGIQAIPSVYQAGTQTRDIPEPSNEILTSQQETQTDLIGSRIKTTSPSGSVNDCRKIRADIYTQTSKTSQQSFRQQPFSLNMWTQTPQKCTAGKDIEPVSDQSTTTGNLPTQLHWSSVAGEDSDNALPLNPKNTVKLYKKSFKRLRRKLTGERDGLSSDSDREVDLRVGRVLESSPYAYLDSWSPQTESSPAQLKAKSETARTRSYRYAHPVLRDVLSLGPPAPSQPTTKHEEIEEAKPEEEITLPPDFLEFYNEFDVAAFLELHHLDVPVSIRKGVKKVFNQKSKSRDQRADRMDVQGKQSKSVKIKPNQKDEQLDDVTSKPRPKPTDQLPPMKKKPEFHQGALNRFEAVEGTRRLSWRDQAPVSRKAQFFKVEADIAGETPVSSDRKLSTSPETSTVRRISLFEGFALK